MLYLNFVCVYFDYFFFIKAPNPADICFSTSLAAASATAELAAFCADLIPWSTAAWAPPASLLGSIKQKFRQF